ncbi:ammonium transmembrane transporter [Aureococcus anophagefferens]|nr:ammonium transmembrane transporter [Aureococcus anophagefferens]
MSDGQYETRGGGARRADDAPPGPPYGAAPPNAQRGSPDPRGAAYGGDRLRRAPSAAPSDHSGSGNFGENFELDDFLERDEAYRQIMTLSGVGAESPLDDGAGNRMWSDDAFGSPGGGTSQRAGAAGGRGWSPGASPAGRPSSPSAARRTSSSAGAAGSFDGGVDAYGEAFDDGSMSFAGLSDGEPLSAASASLRAAAMANYYHGAATRAEPRPGRGARDDPVYAAAIAGRLDAGPRAPAPRTSSPSPTAASRRGPEPRRASGGDGAAEPRAAYDRSDGYDDFGGGMGPLAGEASLYDDAFAAPSRQRGGPGLRPRVVGVALGVGDVAPAAPHRDDAARPEDAGDDARRRRRRRRRRRGPGPSRDGDSPPADHKRYCVPAPAPRPDGDGARAPMDDGSVATTTHSSSRPPEVPPRRGIHDARELEQIYELVFADNAVPMAVVTLDGRFLRTNARFVTSSGFTADELSRVTIFNLTAPAHLHVAFSYMSLVLRGLDPASHLFVCAVTRDAKPAPVALAVSLVTRDGRAQYFSTTLVPLSNVPPQLFANDAERERHGCPPAPWRRRRAPRDDRGDQARRAPQARRRPRPHPTSGPSTAADRRGAAAARARAASAAAARAETTSSSDTRQPVSAPERRGPRRRRARGAARAGRPPRNQKRTSDPRARLQLRPLRPRATPTRRHAMSDLASLEARVAALEGNHGLDDDAALFLPAGDADAFWLLFGMVLVFFMQAGFAMLEVGSVQLKNTKNILIKNVFDASIAAIMWWFFGYGIAFGTDEFGDDGSNGFIGTSQFFYVDGAAASPGGKTYGKAFWLFQWAFAGAAATIVSGAVAERCKFGAYIVYSVVITGFIYPVSGLPQQSVVYQTLGTLILWVGWYGFNGVSTLAITGYGGLASHVMMTTTIAAATGCLATTALGYAVDGVIDTGYANNGILAGLVSITAPCPVVNLWGALIIGAVAAPSTSAYYSDRAEDCAGVFYGGDGGGLLAAILFVLFIIVWVGGTTTALFLGLKVTIGIRCSTEEEDMGMDDSKHGGSVVPKNAKPEVVPSLPEGRPFSPEEEA